MLLFFCVQDDGSSRSVEVGQDEVTDALAIRSDRQSVASRVVGRSVTVSTSSAWLAGTRCHPGSLERVLTATCRPTGLHITSLIASGTLAPDRTDALIRNWLPRSLCWLSLRPTVVVRNYDGRLEYTRETVAVKASPLDQRVTHEQNTPSHLLFIDFLYSLKCTSFFLFYVLVFSFTFLFIFG